MNQEVIFGVAGQSFFYDAPEGQPTGTPTLQVFIATNDDVTGTPEAATSGPCTVDAMNTALAAAAAQGAQEITLADASNAIAGRHYLLAGVGQEWVEVLAIDTGNQVILRQPLKNAYAIGATLVGCRISAPIDPAWSSNIQKITDVLGAAWDTRRATPDVSWAPGTAGYRLRWAYTVGATNTIGVGFADLVRYQSKNLVTPLDVDAVFPGWIDRLATDYRADQGAGLIKSAFTALRLDSLGDELLLRQVRDTQVLKELTIYRAMLLEVQNRALAGGQVDPATMKLAEDLYMQRYTQLLRQPKIPVDKTGGGSSANPTKVAAFRR